jgi:hypothetical protein
MTTAGLMIAPFWCGVLTTVVAEVALLVIAAGVHMMRGKKG